MLDQLAEQRIELSQGMAETLSTSDGPRLSDFRRALERRWGTAKQPAAIERKLEQAEQTRRSCTELRTGRLIDMLTLVGLPLAIAAAFFASRSRTCRAASPSCRRGSPAPCRSKGRTGRPYWDSCS